MKEKVVLAYSGGLDTTALIPWLKETFDYDVVCCCVNCGQGNELDGLDERAKLSGASKLYIEDIVDEFCDDFIVPCVQAGAVYEHKYLLAIVKSFGIPSEFPEKVMKQAQRVPVQNDPYCSNAEIESFNAAMQASLSGVTYIDVYSHLVSEGFSTVDGTHYPDSVSVDIYNYILDHLEEQMSGIWG